MQKYPIYRFTCPDGGVSISLVKPEGECVELARLIAEDGCHITDGVTICECVDTADPGAWEEILSDSAALSVIMGGEPV